MYQALEQPISRGHPWIKHIRMPCQLSLIILEAILDIRMLTRSADVITHDATSQHAAREAVDGIPPLDSSSKRSMPPPRPASSLPVPKKPRVAPPTISDAVVQHADREAVPPKSSDRRAPPTISDATVQHAAREAVPPKPPPRVPHGRAATPKW